MPPKKQSNKQQEAKVKKIVEDKTFGLKNKKKSAKVQKFVEEVKKQASAPSQRKKEQEAKQAPSKKQIEAEKKAQLAEIFKPVLQQQKVPFGTDPKTILCAYFKVGQCTKGDKCKFSHDLNIERKSAKIDLYTDKRGTTKEEESMEHWDQSQLESVIKSKHGNPRTQTDIICKHFLEAIESNKYGWFWTCPNGGDTCKYRHALPPGYVLKKPKTKEELLEEQEQQISLEDYLESERLQLGPNLTPVTPDTFLAWKQKRQARQALELQKQHHEKANALKSGQHQGLSGRDLFILNPDLLVEEPMEGGDQMEEEEKKEEEEGSHFANDFSDDDVIQQQQPNEEQSGSFLNENSQEHHPQTWHASSIEDPLQYDSYEEKENTITFVESMFEIEQDNSNIDPSFYVTDDLENLNLEDVDDNIKNYLD